MILDDLITHAGGKQVRADFEVFLPPMPSEVVLLGGWMIEHDFASVQWVNGRLLVKTKTDRERKQTHDS